MDLSSQLNWLLPLSPGSSGKFALHRLSQLESFISSTQPSEADLKMAPSQLFLPHRPHLSHEGASNDPPGNQGDFPLQQLPFAPPFQPVSLCLPVLAVNMGWTKTLLHYNRLSFSRKALLGVWQKIKYMKAICLHPGKNWALLNPCWMFCEGCPLAVCPYSHGLIFGVSTDSPKCLQDSSSLVVWTESYVHPTPGAYQHLCSVFKPLSSCFCLVSWPFIFSHAQLGNQEMPWREIACRLNSLWFPLLCVHGPSSPGNLIL